MMQRDALSLRIIDLAGATLAVSCLIGSGWVFFVRIEQTHERIKAFSEHVQATQREARTLRTSLGDLRARIVQTHAALEDSGQLPAKAPVEEYFRSLSNLAAKLDLQVMRNSPHGERHYPGLMEERYSFDVAGTTDAVMRFLQGIERSEYWADVGYLKISSGAVGITPKPALRSANLILSLFSTGSVSDRKEPS